MENEVKFPKEQLLKSNQFTQVEKHLLDVMLEENQQYRVKSVKNILNKEKKREVR